MKQTKKLLSLLLAIVMILSSVSVLASALGDPWKNEAIADQYNSIDVPKLTTEQYATAALDEVDRMLHEDGDSIEIYIATVDYTSLNSVFAAIDNITTGSVWTSFKGVLGDLQYLDFVPVQGLQRNNTKGNDLAILVRLLQFLSNNRVPVANFVRGTLNLGTLLPSLVDLSDFAVDKLLKELLYEATYNTDAPSNVTDITVDTMVQDLIDALLVDGYDGDEALLPALDGYTNISNGNMLTFIDNALKVLYNEWLVPRANEVWMDDINELLAKEEVQKYLSYFNVDGEGKAAFEFQPYNFGTDKLVLEQLNDILASIINLALNPDGDIVWDEGGNDQIVENIIKIGKQVLADTGDDFFEPFVEVKTAEELDAMTNEEAVAYVGRTILNSSIDGVWIPNTADTIIKVGSYLVKDLMAVELPERDYSSETAYPVDDINTIYTILTDFGIKALNENPGLDLEYGIGLDALATAAANWAIETYGGLLSGGALDTTKSGWTNLDTLLFKLLNRNWFDASAFDGKAITAENVIKGIIDKVLALDFEGLIGLLCNKSSSSEFVSCSPKQFVINLATRIVNVVFPNAIKTNLTSLDAIIEKENLASTVENLLYDLYYYSQGSGKLLACVLPIVTDVLDLTKEQEFDEPEINVEDTYSNSSGAINFNFEIYNPSNGVNTGYTDPATGVFHQDKLFTLQIDSVTAGSLKVTLPENRDIAPGERMSVNASGNVASTTNIDIVVKYFILKEDGESLTGTTPLEAHSYTCLSKGLDDDAIRTITAVSKNNVVVSDAFLAYYFTNPKDVRNISFKIKNNSTANITVTGANIVTPLSKSGKFVANTEERIVIPKGTSMYNPVTVSDDYDAETDKEALIGQTGTASIGYCKYTRYTQKIGVKVNGVEYSQSISVVLYDDYGLNSLFNSEVNAQRQRSDYGSAEYDAYIAAMASAAATCKTVRLASSFAGTGKTSGIREYEAKATALKDAITALEASRVGGVDALKARLDEINATPGLDNTSYMTYTWSNFRDYRKDAEKLVENYSEGGKYEGMSPAGLDVAMTTWELNNYFARLRPVAPSKVNLALEINEEVARAFDETLYTAESWERLEAAVAAANEVNANAGAFQNEINDAYVELVEAQKRLVPADAEEPAGEWAVAAVSPVDPNYAPQIVVNSAGEKLLLGVAPASSEIAIEEYFDLPAGFTVDCEAIGTGKTATIKDASGNVVDTVVLVVKGDLDGDGKISSFDSSALARAALNIQSLGAADSAFSYAGDLDGSGVINSFDTSALARAALNISTINYAAV